MSFSAFAHMSVQGVGVIQRIPCAWGATLDPAERQDGSKARWWYYPADVGADARSMAANSSSLSSSERAPEFSRTCSGLVAPGIGIT